METKDKFITLEQAKRELELKLVSGESIKTINGNDILGSGNIVIEGAEGSGMLTDMSNIDEDGKQKLNDVAMAGEVGQKLGDLSAELDKIITGGADGKESLSFIDDNEECVMQVKNGHIRTKNFDSSHSVTEEYVDASFDEADSKNLSTFTSFDNADGDDSSISFVDDNDECIAQFKNGHIKTKSFDSSNLLLDNKDENNDVVSLIDDNDECVLQIKGGHVKTKNFDSSDLKNNTTTKIFGFGTFNKNSQWSISDDKMSATTTSLSSKLKDSIVSHSDKFNLSAAITATGDNFEVLIGKWASTSGTMFGLKKNGVNSYLTTYLVENTSNPTLVDTLPLTNINLVSGEKYFVRIEKRTNKWSYYNIYITDLYGNTDVINNYGHITIPEGGDTSQEGWGSRCGYSWGQICLYMLSGSSMLVERLSFSIPTDKDIRLVCLGSSYIEGNSIANDKDKKFSTIVCSKIGENKTIQMGQGGQLAKDLKEYVKVYAKWFRNADYALISIGGNDINGNPTPAKQTECIGYLQEIDDILRANGIKPVWMVFNGWLRNATDDMSINQNWLLSQECVVDTRKAFPCVRSSYLTDEKHPTIEMHTKIAKCIESQASYLFN